MQERQVWYTEDMSKLVETTCWLLLKLGKVAASHKTETTTVIFCLLLCMQVYILGVTDKERLLKEVSLMLMLTFSHPNVMPLIRLSFDKETPLVIMPFMPNGTVLSYVRENKKNLYFLESSDKLQVRHC